MSLSRSLLGLVVGVMVGATAAPPALAYGAENWQLGFSGTGVAPGSVQGFGFWGWCAYGGGVTSGTTGDCQFAEYIHTTSGGSFTCEESLDITSWNIAKSATTGVNDFFISGTVTVHPTSLTGPCVAFFPGPGLNSFAGVDTTLPAAPGHYSLPTVDLGFGPGLTGEFQIQVTQIQ